MGELWDIYDKNKNKTGSLAERDVYRFCEGEYHIVVTGIIINDENKILISKRAKFKKNPEMWECNGGSILAGETSLQGILRELKEELGVDFKPEDAIFLKEIRRDKVVPDFKDLWLFHKNVKDEEITFPDGEATEFKWVTIDEFEEMLKNKEIIHTIDFGREEYELALEKIETKKQNRYYDITESDKPRKNVKYFIQNISEKPASAIELGCGTGNDTIYLIKNGWNVLSIDKEDVEDRINKRLNTDEQEKFTFKKQRFEKLQLSPTDLIVANNSLSFCNPQNFNNMWKSIKENILQGGYFVGNFFGINDSWAEKGKQMTFLTKEEVYQLFEGFEMIRLEEIEEEKPTAFGKMKHWHIFNIIARKK